MRTVLAPRRRRRVGKAGSLVGWLTLSRASALLGLALVTGGANCGPDVVSSRPFVGELPITLDRALEGVWVEPDPNASSPLSFTSHGDHYILDAGDDVVFEGTTARLRGHRYLSLTSIEPSAPAAWVVLRYAIDAGQLCLHELDGELIRERLDGDELSATERRFEISRRIAFRALAVEELESFVAEHDPLTLFPDRGSPCARRDARL